MCVGVLKREGERERERVIECVCVCVCVLLLPLIAHTSLTIMQTRTFENVPTHTRTHTHLLLTHPFRQKHEFLKVTSNLRHENLDKRPKLHLFKFKQQTSFPYFFSLLQLISLSLSLSLSLLNSDIFLLKM